MVPTVPPEIWLRIALFIPSHILKKLYSVNPVFLDLALNEKYSDLNLAIRWTATTIKLLKHLNHPHIAHRVQRLTLSYNWLNSLDLPEEVTLGTAVAWYLPFNLGRFINPTVCKISGVKICDSLMEIAVVNFLNVSSLTIVDGPCPPVNMCLRADPISNFGRQANMFATSTSPNVFSPQNAPSPLLVNTYIACASNLRTLHLIAKSANFNAIFPPNPSVLASLEEVTLSFSPLDGSSADAKAASTFFQAIASTLTSLAIMFYCTYDEPSRLLQSLPQGKTAFPKLTSLSLFHSQTPASPDSNLVQFLNQHADTLKHLRLQHTNTAPFVSQLPLLPHLETLSLDGSSFLNRPKLASNEGLDAARAYIQHSGSTLTGLHLAHCFFTIHDLGILLDLLELGSLENTEGGGLKSLTVTVQVLSSQVLDMVVEKLPQLEMLEINFGKLRSNDGTDVWIWARASLGDLLHEVQSCHLFSWDTSKMYLVSKKSSRKIIFHAKHI